MDLNLTKKITSKQTKPEIPPFKTGDRIKIQFQITEGNKTRLQAFEGVVIKRSGQGSTERVLIRRYSFGIGVERIFPLHSPKVASIEVLSRGKVRQSRIYYMRQRRGKKARIKTID